MDQQMIEEDVSIELEEGEIKSVSDEAEMNSVSDEGEIKSLSEAGEIKSMSDEEEIKSMMDNDVPEISKLVQSLCHLVQEQEEKQATLQRNIDSESQTSQDVCPAFDPQAGLTTVYTHEGYNYYYDYHTKSYLPYPECSEGENVKLDEEAGKQGSEETKEVIIESCPLKYEIKKLAESSGGSECMNINNQQDSTENPKASAACETVNECQNQEQDLAKQYPPCVRIVVENTDIPTFKIGTLFIVTCVDNATIGRLPRREIYIPDTHVSRAHARLWYDNTDKNYKILDLGSKKGVALNNERLEPSKSYSVLHNSLITLHKTELRCHIHIGNDTCDGCEPGVVQQNSQNTERPITRSPCRGNNKKDLHRKEEKRLKQKYGLMGDYVVTASKVAQGYEDKARSRRNLVGSSNPHEKTQQASIDTPIANDNKGYEMLSKMGWTDGQSLGRNNKAIIQPSDMIGPQKWKPLQKL